MVNPFFCDQIIDLILIIQEGFKSGHIQYSFQIKKRGPTDPPSGRSPLEYLQPITVLYSITE